MTDEVGNLILEQFKGFRNDVATLRAEMHGGFDELKSRMSSLESAMVGVKRDVNHADEVDARQQLSLDRMNARIERIERRLDLSEAT